MGLERLALGHFKISDLRLIFENDVDVYKRQIPSCTDEVKAVCAFMERHYAEHISLEQLCRCVGPVSYTHLDVYKRQAARSPALCAASTRSAADMRRISCPAITERHRSFSTTSPIPARATA